MPSKIDRAFIDNLQNFTNALENIVELLEQQYKKGDDAINHMMSAMDGDKIGKISEDIKQILELSTNVDGRTKEILEEVKAARKQKESGLFGKIKDKENEDKIVSGVEVILLIAGGVLAIGLAFQLVGKVDFLSVLALSAGILAVSFAFAEIGKMEDLTPKKALLIGLAFITMAAAITISSIILQGFQPLNPITMLSLVFVAGALGAAVYFLSMAIEKMSFEAKDIAKYLLLPIILPAIAGGLVLSSWILQFMQPVSWDKVLSMAVVGIGLAIGSVAIMFIMKAFGDNIDYKKILVATLALPVIAAGLVAASYAFMFFQPIEKPFEILIGAFVIGLSILAFVPAVMLMSKIKLKDLATGSLGIVMVAAAIVATSWILSFGKFEDNYPTLDWATNVGLAMIVFTPAVFFLSKIDPVSLLIGGLGAIIVATAIMASSWILTIGKYDDNYPSLKWALGTGLALLLFTPAVLALGIIAMTGIGALAIGLGALLVPLVAASIVASSHIFALGKYEDYPSAKWALGTGLALAAFSIGLVTLGLIPFGKKLIRRGAERVALIAESIKDASLILADGNYTGGPTKKWAEGIGLALGAFSQALDASTEGSIFKKSVDKDKFANFMESVATGMIKVAQTLGDYDWNDKYPKKEWAEGVSTSLMPFIAAYEAMSTKQSLLGKIFGSSDDKFGDFMVMVAESMVKVSKVLVNGIWSGGPDETWSRNVSTAISAFTDSFASLDEDKVEIIDDFTDSIKKLVKELNRLNTDGIDKLNNLTASITIMSAIDDANLKKVLNVLDDNKKQLSNVISVEGSSGQAPQKQVSPQVVATVGELDQSQTDSNDKILEKFDNVLAKFDELLEYVVQDKGGQNVNISDKI